MANRTINTTVRFTGIKPFVKDLRLLGNELRRLDGAKATIVVEVREKGISNQSMIVDAEVVERALTQGMRLEPSMLADYINNGRILPDKMAMFIAGLNRELMKNQTANRGRKKVITSRKEFMKVYGKQYLERPRFLYFKSQTGRSFNDAADQVLRSVL